MLLQLHFVVVVQVIPGAKSSVAEEVTPNDTLCHTCQFLKVHNGSSKGGNQQAIIHGSRKNQSPIVEREKRDMGCYENWEIFREN